MLEKAAARTSGSTEYNIGALIIRIGFVGIVYYNHTKEPPK